MTLSTLEHAHASLERTAGLDSVLQPFEGGRHEFRWEANDDGDAEVYLELAGKDYYVDRPALESAVKRIPGADEQMASRWPLDMVMAPLNWFFDNRSGDFKAMVLDDNIVAITKPNAVLFDPRSILDACVEEVGKYGDKDTIEIDHLQHSLDLTRFTVRPREGMSERFIEAKPGDITLGGLHFEGSLLGKQNIEVSLATHRVECANGMISTAGVRRFKLDEDEGGTDALNFWITETCEQLYGGSPMDEEFERIDHLTDHEISGHVGEVLSDLFARLRVPASYQTHVHDALEDEADGTMYGVVQAMTRAATHAPGFTGTQRANLMRHASSAALHAQSLCDSCKRPTY